MIDEKELNMIHLMLNDHLNVCLILYVNQRLEYLHHHRHHFFFLRGKYVHDKMFGGVQ
jgi:hypothetical protein